MHRSKILGAVVSAVLAVAGCDDPSEPQRAAAVHVLLPDELSVGDTVTARAVALTAGGDTLAEPAVTWTTSGAGTVTVDDTGLVAALETGVVEIRATVDGVTGGATVTVYSVVASLELDRDTATIMAGSALQLSAIVLDPEGEPAVRPVQWTSDDTLVARVDDDGTVSGRSAGVTDIRAAAGGFGAAMRVRVHDDDPTWVEIGAGLAHTCARTPGGLVMCWGSDGAGALGRGAGSGESATPVPVDTYERIEALAVGGAHACGLNTEGAALCWGAADYGQLGSQAASETCEAGSCAARPVAVAGGLTFDALAAGAQATCGAAGETVYCWGRSDNGQLGTGTPSSCAAGPCQPIPVAVGAGLPLVTPAPGQLHTCALDTSGQAFCWGSGEGGYLGHSFTSPRTLPVAVGTTRRFGRIAAGSRHTCALEDTGGAVCWGLDTTGQIGSGFISGSCAIDNWAWDCATLPESVATSNSIRRIDASLGASHEFAHTCATINAGAALCWGAGHEGQLGTTELLGTCRPRDVTYPCTRTPVTVALPAGELAAEITAGGAHSCVVTADGEAFCWGRGAEGQLGTGEFTGADTPVRVGP